MKHLIKLFPFIKKYRLQIIITLGLLLGLTGLGLIIPALIREIIDRGLSQRDLKFLTLSALAVLVIGVLRAIFTFYQSYISEWLGARVGYDMRNFMYDHIQYLSFSFHDNIQTGQLISRTIEDVRSIERFVAYGVIELIRLLLMSVGILAVLFSRNIILAFIALSPLIIIVIITTNFGRKIGGFFLKVDKSIGELSSHLQENVSGVQIVKAFAREEYEINRFSKANRKLYDTRINLVSRWSRVMPTSHALITLGTILILYFGGQMVLRGEITIGELVAFNSYMIMLAQPAHQLTWLVNMAGEAVAGVQRTYEILELEPEIKSAKRPVKMRSIKGEVIFDDVNFKYKDEKEYALKSLNIEVKPNQIIALVGPTGSGKTSLINLLPRFYDTSKGSVLIDGIDVRAYDLVDLRSQIGIVLQTSLLFSSSIKENISYGRPDASEEEIIICAKSAQAHDFIMDLPEGYDTVIGERGITLSGGQRQRIAIARALLMDPRILILDDSTSSVDTETEREIQIALDRLMEGRTTFIIAHRVSTVRRADQILVMEDGEIVERGTHQELLDPTSQKGEKGFYRTIHDIQIRGKREIRELEEYQTIEKHEFGSIQEINKEGSEEEL